MALEPRLHGFEVAVRLEHEVAETELGVELTGGGQVLDAKGYVVHALEPRLTRQCLPEPGPFEDLDLAPAGAFYVGNIDAHVEGGRRSAHKFHELGAAMRLDQFLVYLGNVTGVQAHLADAYFTPAQAQRGGRSAPVLEDLDQLDPARPERRGPPAGQHGDTGAGASAVGQFLEARQVARVVEKHVGEPEPLAEEVERGVHIHHPYAYMVNTC